MKNKLNVTIVALNSKFVHTNIAAYYLNKKISNISNSTVMQLSVNDNINKLIESIISTKPDLLCFGVYIWNNELVYKLCDSIKKINPSIIIALGGPEVSHDYKDILNKHPYIDSIMILESENNIIELVEDVTNKHLKEVYNTPTDILDVPFIAADLIKDCSNRPIYFETSRGCPFSCSYCTSCIDKTVRYRNLDLVKKDLKLLLDADVKQIRFIDRTFNSDRKRAIDLWTFLLKNRKSTTFHFEICAKLIDSETLEFLKTVPKNVFRFEIGIQSTNRQTLKSINRTYSFNKEKDIITKLVKDTNIFIHSDLIIGLPHEDLITFISSFNELYKLNTDEMQLGFLKILKGTHIYNDIEKFGYVYNNFSPFEILKNNYITFEEISFLKKFEIVFELLNNSLKFKESIKYLLTKFHSPFNLFETITTYFIDNNIIDSLSYDNVYESLIHMFDNDTILIQLLSYDYFNNFKGTKSWMYTKYDMNKEINYYIQNILNIPYSNHSEYFKIVKENKFLVLDYDINTKEQNKTIYMKNK